MKTRVLLTPQARADITYLSDNGVETYFISRFARAYYGVTRTSIYRYIKPQERIMQPPRPRPNPLYIQTLLCQGLNSQQIATALQLSLETVNQAIIRNKLSALACQRH